MNNEVYVTFINYKGFEGKDEDYTEILGVFRYFNDAFEKAKAQVALEVAQFDMENASAFPLQDFKLYNEIELKQINGNGVCVIKVLKREVI